MKFILIATTLIGLASTNMLEKRGIPDAGTFKTCIDECKRCYAKWNALTDNVDRFIAGGCRDSLRCSSVSVETQAATNLFMCTQACLNSAIEELYAKVGTCCNASPSTTA